MLVIHPNLNWTQTNSTQPNLTHLNLTQLNSNYWAWHYSAQACSRLRLFIETGKFNRYWDWHLTRLGNFIYGKTENHPDRKISFLLRMRLFNTDKFGSCRDGDRDWAKNVESKTSLRISLISERLERGLPAEAFAKNYWSVCSCPIEYD